MADASFKLTVYTPEGPVVEVEATHVFAPGKDGYLGILANHAPLVTSLDVGVLDYTDAETGDEVILAIANGFLEVSKNQVSILADSAEPYDMIDLERCQAALKRAEDRVCIADGSVDILRAQQALKRAYTRVQVRLKKFTF